MKKRNGLLRGIGSQSLHELLGEFSWIYRQSLQYKGEILWYIFTGLLGTVIALAGSVLSKYIIDAVTGQDSKGIVAALVFFLLMQLTQILIGAFSSRISAKIGIRVNQSISAQVYDKLLDTQWEALSEYHSGDLLSRVMGDISTISSSVLGWLPDLITRLIQFAGTLGVILYYDSTLAMLALLSAPVTLLLSRIVIKKMRGHNLQMRQLSSQMVIFNEETFQNLQMIKAFDRTAAYSEKHRKLQQSHKEATLEFNRFSIQKNSLMSLVGTVVAMVCFGWGIYRLWSGHITYGTMTLFLQLSASLSAAFSALAGLIPSAISAATAAGRIMAITELPNEDHRGRSRVRAFAQAHGAAGLRIQAQGLSYGYHGGRTVLSKVDFLAQAGQIVTVIGPSGEGKTTLLRLLLGIIRPTEGTLEVCARSGEALPVSPATRQLFAYVPQGNTLFSGTVAENLRLIKPEATDQELLRVLKIACAEDFVMQLPLGLDSLVKEQGGGFSQGQVQRLCIARALLSDAPILLMDEATSALDMETEHQVLRNIMRTRENRTCIITTHRPSVLDISDQIYCIKNDRIEPVEKDTRKE